MRNRPDAIIISSGRMSKVDALRKVTIEPEFGGNNRRVWRKGGSEIESEKFRREHRFP